MDPEPERPPLRDFQTWMQTFIVSAGTPDQALKAAEQLSGFAQGSAERMVKRSPTLNEMERLMIYRRMYPLRMEEALAIDFPVVKSLLGAKRFADLVGEYVEIHPSRSWTLDHLGQHMVPFIEGHPLRREYPGLFDLVRLEQALCEVFNASDAPALTPEDLAEVDPEAWFDARLECIPALRLLPLLSNSNDLYKAHNASLSLPGHQGGSHFVVVWRHQFQTWRLPVAEPAFAILSRLAEGLPLGEALGYALDNYPSTDEGQVFEWFNTWVGEGFFQKLQGPESMPGVPTPSNLHPR